MRTAFVLAALAALSQPARGAEAVEKVQFLVRFPAPETRAAEIEARWRVAPGAQVEIAFARWTPGSYLMREYARLVEGMRFEDGTGAALASEQSGVGRWRVTAGSDGEVVARYRVLGHERGVRTNSIAADGASLVGAATFPVLVGREGGPQRVVVEPGAGWDLFASPLLPDLLARGGGRVTLEATTWHALLDAPIWLGARGTAHRIEVDGVPIVLLDDGELGVFDGAGVIGDIGRVVEASRDVWGRLPYRHFLFLNLIDEGGGGIEHAEATVLQSSRFALRTPKSRRDWLGLVAHEHFHAWNHKQIAPTELVDPPLDHEVLSDDLWIVEGVTSYYDDLLVHRAELSTEKEYLEALSKNLSRLAETPGRLGQSLAESSRDAWIRLYRPDAQTPNTTISYYTKGAVVAWLLDARIRSATDGAASLDDVLRAAWERFPEGYSGAAFEALASEIAGEHLGPFFDLAVRSTGELAFDQALTTLGLRFVQPTEDDEAKAWLGSSTTERDGRHVLKDVRRGTPAAAAGLEEGDEVLAIDRFRLPSKGVDSRLEAYRPGDVVSLTVARRDELMEIPVTLGSAPFDKQWRLEVDPDAPAEAAARRAAWLGHPAEAEEPEPEAPAQG